MKLTESNFQQFTLAKKVNVDGHVNSLDYTKDGKLLALSTDNGELQIISCDTATQVNVSNSKKYGIAHCRFTHSPAHILCASRNSWDGSLRYWDIEKQQFLRYFKGHHTPVHSLSMSPRDDSFISAAREDGSVRLWDLRHDFCHGVIRCVENTVPVVAHDSQGLVFACTVTPSQVKLFDTRGVERGPFSTFTLNRSSGHWLHLEFSPTGNLMLLLTEEEVTILNAYDGSLVAVLHPPKDRTLHSANFSPDGQFVMAGTSAGEIVVWHPESTGTPLFKFGTHTGEVSVVKFNPRLMMLASGCDEVALWVPRSVS